jgi:hypothetical protein
MQSGEHCNFCKNTNKVNNKVHSNWQLSSKHTHIKQQNRQPTKHRVKYRKYNNHPMRKKRSNLPRNREAIVEVYMLKKIKAVSTAKNMT